ncbi:YcxB family protein [Xanthomonas sp. LMG 8992]|uniref:YcxB family protein n=1 Tax=Xanthomonas sp. LMG 8992 TaxID=1591157 RepID=UPI00136C1DC8|nr:YcxB family protein [Xanthomonas sp. LMG 8992]MXV09904.1 YcxB family protein [Xanthomonas sp. LMG 8992]
MISGSITVQDYLAAQRLHQRRGHRRVLLVMAALLLGLAVFAFARHGSGMAIIGVMLAVAGGGGLIGQTIQSAWTMPRKVRRLHAQQAALRHRLTYRWDAAGLEITWADGRVQRSWRDDVRYRENAQVLMLYQNDVLFDLVPTSWFADAAQRDAFRQLAAAQVGTDGGKRAV